MYTERRSYIVQISYTDHITNHDQVRNRVQQAIGQYEELLATVKKRKLRWYDGHITRSTGLSKTILQSTVPGKRKQGR